MSDEKKAGSTDQTQLGLPEITQPPSSATQVMDAPVAGEPTVTSPDIAPVLTTPPKTRTDATIEMPSRKKTGDIAALGAVPQAQTAPRRASKMAVAIENETTAPPGVIPQVPSTPRRSRMAEIATSTTDPQVSVPTADLQPVAPKAPPAAPGFEWTMQRVAGVAGAVSLVFILTWVFWPSGGGARPVRAEPRREPVVDAPAPTPQPTAPKPVAPVAPAAPKRPTFALDIKQNVIDPYAVHLDDIPLDPAHKYRLKLERDDSRLGVALARLDEKGGWGALRRMASHAALQFGGAKALRMHCEPGSSFADDATVPLELVDLANKKVIAVPLSPSRHCWDFEVGRMLELGEGVKKRVRVPTDAKLQLGEGVPLKVAWVVESLGENKTWRTGVLGPGESLLAEGRLVRFALLDPYAPDNEGTLELELLEGDTESSGIVTPSTASGAQFVPVK